MARQRLYAIAWPVAVAAETSTNTTAAAAPGVPTSTENRQRWTMERSKRRAVRLARAQRGIVRSMPLPLERHAWDWPTFNVCADRTEVDYRGR